MRSVNLLLTLTIVLSISFSYTAFSQSSGTWIIPSGSPSYITPGYLDSLDLIPPDPMNPPGFTVGQDSIGKLMFWSDIYVENDSTKQTAINYLCGELYWFKLESQRDTINNSIEYQTGTTSLDSTGNEFWTESIYVNVIDSSEIVINSSADVVAKIYEAYEIVNPTYTEFNVNGSGVNENYYVNLSSGVTYIIVFIKNENSIVYAKRIKG